MHIQAIDDPPPLVEFDNQEEDNANDIRTSRPDNDIISTNKYPIHVDLDRSLEDVIRTRLLKGEIWFNETFEQKVIQENICICGSINLGRTGRYTKVRVFTTLYLLMNYEIVERVCCECERFLPFDGRKLGLVNYKNQIVFTVELFYELLNYKAYSGLPTFTFWRSKIDFYSINSDADINSVARLLWKKKLENYSGLINQIFVGFCTLLEIPNDLFYCCPNPKVVNVDGLVISIETNRLNTQSLTNGAIIPDINVPRNLGRTDRNVIDYAETDRLLLNEYITSGISHARWLSFLQAQVEPAKSFYTNSCWSIGLGPQQSVYYCKETYAIMISTFTKSINPAIQLCPLSIWLPWDQYIANQCNHYELQLILRKWAPIFFKMFNLYLRLLDSSLTEAVVLLEFLKYVLQKTKDIYQIWQDNPVEDVQGQIGSGDDRYIHGQYFPSRPITRRIRVNQQGNSQPESTICSKNAKHNTKLTGGVVLFWCGEHRCCIGWNMVPNGESPKLVYEILASRFQLVPKVNPC
jgi:hypothetical protein